MGSVYFNRPHKVLKTLDFTRFFLLEISLKKTLKCLAVSGLVAGHFMDGVVDGVQTVLLGASGQIELALGCAELAVNAPCQILLGVSPTGMQNRPFGPFQA